MVPDLSAKPSHCEDAGAVRMQAPSNKWDAARGSGRKFLSRHARATGAEQLRFYLKSHTSKLLKNSKAASTQICQVKVNFSDPVTSKSQFFLVGERFFAKRLIFWSRPGAFERFPVTPKPFDRKRIAREQYLRAPAVRLDLELGQPHGKPPWRFRNCAKAASATSDT